jgi:hypothetical protein
MFRHGWTLSNDQQPSPTPNALKHYKFSTACSLGAFLALTPPYATLFFLLIKASSKALLSLQSMALWPRATTPWLNNSTPKIAYGSTNSPRNTFAPLMLFALSTRAWRMH